MKKLLLMILILALLAININCGGGGGSSTNTSGRTTVTINIGETRTASHASGKLLSTASTIPSDVTSIKFTISATDMATIEWVISVAGRTTISESFEVSTGANRHFLVEAIGASGKVLYRGETFANLDRTPITLTIVMVSTDKTPPTFEGIISATAKSTTEIELSWTAATDNITLQDKIQYLIYMSTTSNGENFALPSFTTSPGVTSFSVTRLSPDTTYYFMVRAMDERGNIDTNLFEKFATTLAPPDIIKPTFGGIISAIAVSSTEINLSWGSATDDRTASSNIVYLIYMSTTSQGQNFAIPTASITGGTSKTITGLTPGTTYHFVVRAMDEAGNIDTNILERFATTPTPPDKTLPTFGGLGSATAVSSTEISLSWNSATDNVTPSSNIVYLIYMSTTSQGQNFAIPTASITGVTSKTITGLTPGTTYHFVVRAMDEAGNIDTNTVEKPAKTKTPTTVYVDASNVPGPGNGTPDDPFIKIQDGINAASAGDMVQVATGTYNENIVMKSRVDVIGSGAGVTTIVGQASVSGVVLFDNVTNAKLSGFKITVNAPIPGTDRAVVFQGMTNATAVLQKCVLTGTQYGIFVWAPAAPIIENNTIVGISNEQGIYIGNSATSPIIRNNIITGYTIFAGIHVVAGNTPPLPVIEYNNLWNNATN